MTLKTFAKRYYEMDVNELKDTLIEEGFFKANGTPKAKYINDDTFDENGNVLDVDGLRDSLNEIINVDDEDDEDETDDSDDEDEDEDDEDDSDEDDGDEDLDDLDFDTLRNTIEDFNFDDKESLADIGHLIIEKLKDFEDDEEDEDEDDDFEVDVKPNKKVTSKSKKSTTKYDDEDEDDEDEDPNAPGTYRGWKISKEGIKIIAKKGRKVLTTSFKGNIRNKIDEEED